VVVMAETIGVVVVLLLVVPEIFVRRCWDFLKAAASG
jgi:hypothetical protein